MKTFRSTLTLALVLGVSAAASATDAKKLPEGKSVLTPGIEGHRLHTGPDGKYAQFETIDVKDQPFKKAIRAKVKERPSDPWHAQISTLTATPVKKDDVVLISFQVRTIESKNSGGKGQFNVYFGVPETELEVTLSQEITAGPKWRQVQIPATVAASYESGKAMLNLDLGFEPQTLEFADIKLINYGDKVRQSDLPSSGD